MAHAAGRTVWRVGHSPDPWAWTPWQYAHAGRFGGRWDDPDGRWRTQYAGHRTLAATWKVLAVLRPDPRLAAELDAITEDPTAATDFPTCRSGTVPRSKLSLLLGGPAGAEMLAK